MRTRFILNNFFLWDWIGEVPGPPPLATPMMALLLFARSWVCHCCLRLTSRLLCKRFMRPSAMTMSCRWLGSYSGNVRSTSLDRHQERHDFHRLVTHFWLMRSLIERTECWCGSGAIRPFAFLCVAQTLTGPWTVAVRYAEPPYIWCCAFTHDCVELLVYTE